MSLFDQNSPGAPPAKVEPTQKPQAPQGSTLPKAPASRAMLDYLLEQTAEGVHKMVEENLTIVGFPAGRDHRNVEHVFVMLFVPAKDFEQLMKSQLGAAKGAKTDQNRG